MTELKPLKICREIVIQPAIPPVNEELKNSAKSGHWIIGGFMNECSTCSNCNWTHELNYEMDARGMEPFRRCPNCGAKMFE